MTLTPKAPNANASITEVGGPVTAVEGGEKRCRTSS